MKGLRQYFAYFLGCAVFLGLFPYCIFQLAHQFPIPIFSRTIWQMIFAGAFLSIGTIFIVLSNLQMKNQGKGNPVDGFDFAIGERTKHLMMTGIYQLCRNPMLLGTFLFYLGLAFALNSWTGMLFPIGFVLFMVWYVQKFEQPRLERDFGEQYQQYKNAVPLLIPRFYSLIRRS